MKRSLLFTLLLTACAPVNTPEPRYTCGVEDASQQEQALIKVSPNLTFVLPEALGGLACTPDGSDACAAQLDEQCIAQLDAVVGVPVTTSIGLDNRSQVGSRIQGIALEGDCAAAWQLSEPVPEFVEADTTAQVALTFVGTSAGTCTARLVVTSDAENFDANGTASIVLSAVVTE
jgi:hypothetical protein